MTFFILPRSASLELEQFNLKQVTKKGGHTGALLPGARGSQLHFFLFFRVILLQLNPQAALLPNFNAIYKLTAAKFPYFPNSHRASRARQWQSDARATHTSPLH